MRRRVPSRQAATVKGLESEDLGTLFDGCASLVHVALWRVTDVAAMHSDSDVAVVDEAGADFGQSLQITLLLLPAPPNPFRHENFKVSVSRDTRQI